MVHNHENIKLSNKEQILNKINEKSKFPMAKNLMKHELVENGLSSYNYDLGSIEVFAPIIKTFKKAGLGELQAFKINKVIRARLGDPRAFKINKVYN